MIGIIEKFSFPIILCTPIASSFTEIDNEQAAGKGKKKNRVFYLKRISYFNFPFNCFPPTQNHLLLPLLSTSKCKGITEMYHFLIIKGIFFVSLSSTFSLLSTFPAPAREWNKSKKIVSLHLRLLPSRKNKNERRKSIFHSRSSVILYSSELLRLEGKSKATSCRMKFEICRKQKE